MVCIFSYILTLPVLYAYSQLPVASQVDPTVAAVMKDGV